MSELADLQPESLQALADDALLNAEARAAAAQEAEEDFAVLCRDQGKKHLATLSTRYDTTVRDWATEAQSVTADLTRLAEQTQAGFLNVDDCQQQLNRINGRVAHLRSRRDELAKQVEAMDEWEPDPAGAFREMINRYPALRGRTS